MHASTGPTAVGVVLAAGMGTRVGADGNKAYLPLAGRSMVAWSVDAVADAPGIGRTVLVYRRGERELAARTVDAEVRCRTVELVEGGDTRHGSEWNVLRYLSADIEAGSVNLVLIHDAARPLAGPDMMHAALATADEFGGAIPGLAARDVVREDGPEAFHAVAGTLVRVQTPQAFRAAPLLAAYRAAAAEGFDGTDTSACMQRFTDVDVHVFPGAATNLKVTFGHDVALASHLLATRAEHLGRP